jgi:hypothetical protein
LSDLPTRAEVLAELKKADKGGDLPLRIGDILTLLSPGKPQGPFMDLFMGYTLPFFGSRVAFVPFHPLAALVTGANHDYPEPNISTFQEIIKPANVIAGVIPASSGDTHFMAIIVAWKEKKLFYIDPFGDPVQGRRFISGARRDHMEGFRTLLAWISLVKDQKEEAAQGFDFVSVGLPEQFRQASGECCMAISCAIQLVFCRFFAHQMSTGQKVHLPPQMLPSPGGAIPANTYNFPYVCIDQPLLVTQNTLVAFQSGLLRLIAESIEAKEFLEDMASSAPADFQAFLSKSLEEQLTQMHQAVQAKYSIPDLLNLVSDPLTPLEVLTVHKELQSQGYNKADELTKNMSTGRVLLLLLLSRSFPKSEPNYEELSMIFNAVPDHDPTKPNRTSYFPCPPVSYTTETMGPVEPKHFKRAP